MIIASSAIHKFTMSQYLGYPFFDLSKDTYINHN